MNLLLYADSDGVVFAGMTDECAAGKNAICPGSTACNGEGECLQYGQCSCSCNRFGEDCAFGPEIHDLEKINENSDVMTVKGSTKGQYPLYFGLYGAVHYDIEIESGGLEVTTCTEDTVSGTYLVLTRGCVNNDMFQFPMNLTAESGTDSKCAGVSAARLNIDDLAAGQYRLIVMGSGSDGGFGLSYGPSGSIGIRVIGNSSPSSVGTGYLFQMLFSIVISAAGVLYAYYM